MHMQREIHPTLLSSLEGIVDQMVWFRENWHEEVRRTKALVACMSDFGAACVFSRLDGEKILQLVVRTVVQLCICVKTSWCAHLVYVYHTTWSTR